MIDDQELASSDRHSENIGKQHHVDSNSSLNVAKSTTSKKAKKTITSKEPLSLIIKSVRALLQKNLDSDSDDIVLPQLIWLLFLKFLDDSDYAHVEELGESYEPIITAPYRWRDWVAVENKTLQMKGDELLAFINNDLFSYLSRLSSSHDRDIRTIVGSVFQGTNNLVRSGYILRQIVDELNIIDFNSSQNIRTFIALYENMLKEIRDAAGKKSNFYTPRPVIRFIINRLSPKFGERMLDPACGTGGFLVEAYEFLRDEARSPEQHKLLQDSLMGIEKKSMPYLFCVMNMLLHGIEYPGVIERNTLSTNIRQIKDADHVDVIAINPTFDEKEEQGILNNFPEGMRSTDTYLLFLQYIMAMLKRPGGKCAIVVPNGFLFGGDNVSIEVKQRLLTRFNLHTIIRLPKGVFAPSDTLTNILFFEACPPDDEEICTREIWYYELPLPEERMSYTKTKPLRDEEFADCIAWWDKRKEDTQAWKIPVEQILTNNCNLDIKNPHRKEEAELLSPEQLIDDIKKKEYRILNIIEEINRVLGET